MDNYDQQLITELSWREARKEMQKVNRKLVSIIDQVDPDKEHTFYKVRYFYGDEILKRGKLYLPTPDSGLTPIDDPYLLDPKIRKSLGYNLESNPVMMILNGAVELFLPLKDRTVFFGNVLEPGKLLGVSRVSNQRKLSHHPVFLWEMTAGARSIFMLARISDSLGYKKLRSSLGIGMDISRKLADHWHVFSKIAQRERLGSPWYVDVLFFTKKWFDHMNDPAWMPFNHYLLQTTLRSSEFSRDMYYWDGIFSFIQQSLYFKPNPFVVSTAKHLLAISTGEAPGFAPALDDSYAPISMMQKIFTEIYNLNYIPTIIQPCQFDISNRNNRPVYYSLRYPTATEFGQKSRERDDLTTDLFEIRGVLNNYLRAIASDSFNLDETPFYLASKNIAFDYFHSEIDPTKYSEIKTADEIPRQDDSFKASEPFKQLKFPSNSIFFNGCIRIMHKGKS
jgi:hypothetical protein